MPMFRLRKKLPIVRKLGVRWYPQAGRMAPRKATRMPVRKKPERHFLADKACSICVSVFTGADRDYLPSGSEANKVL